MMIYWGLVGINRDANMEVSVDFSSKSEEILRRTCDEKSGLNYKYCHLTSSCYIYMCMYIYIYVESVVF
jgi:hypothetical protein